MQVMFAGLENDLFFENNFRLFGLTITFQMTTIIKQCSSIIFRGLKFHFRTLSLKGSIMRYFKFCVPCFAILALISQISFAQTAAIDKVTMDGTSYNLYNRGVVVGTDGVVQGLLVDVNGLPIPNMTLTIVGSDGFMVTVETDENGNFFFEDAEVGSYTVVLEDGGTLTSLDFRVSAVEPNPSTLAPSTGVNNKLILAVNENGLLKFAANRGKLAPVTSAAATQAAAAPAGAGGAAGAAGGAFGNAGLLAAGLGAAGLAAGVAALSDNKSTPVSVGAPASK